jgi:DNA-binding NtrC family response regulator
MQGRVTRVRRPVPPARLGPPWWEITFVPLREQDKLIAVLGVIVPIGQPTSTAGGKGLSEALVALRQHAAERTPLSLFESDSPLLARIRAQAELAAQTLSPVWITGAPGTGKETLARAIHYHGVTRERAFVGIDCAGLQPYLIRATLFGHNGLAETGRVGTIYLKSAEALPVDLQAELVEWAELLSDQCRVIVGTAGGESLSTFRASFGVIEIQLPALVERREDLPRLVATMLDPDAKIQVSPEAMAVLASWHWPGNLRELREVVRGAGHRAGGGAVEIQHLPLAIRKAATDARAAAGAPRPQRAPKLDELLEQVERRMIELALRKAKGDHTSAAEALGIHRSRLARRIKALGLGE